MTVAALLFALGLLLPGPGLEIPLPVAEPVIRQVPGAPRVFSASRDATLPDHVTVVARARGGITVHDRPSSDVPTLTLSATTILGTPTVVEVLSDPGADWLEVLLPIRPNGSTGWIRRDDVMLYLVEDRIVIDLSDRTLTLYQEGRETLGFPVGIGAESTPTPIGNFYVTDRVRLANPNSIWGPYALGLSGRSEVIMEYNGGDGIIGIHGTSQPTTIGTPSSLGCVRLENGDMTELYEHVLIGTPVEIRP